MPHGLCQATAVEREPGDGHPDFAQAEDDANLEPVRALVPEILMTIAAAKFDNPTDTATRIRESTSPPWVPPKAASSEPQARHQREEALRRTTKGRSLGSLEHRSLQLDEQQFLLCPVSCPVPTRP